MRIFLKAILWFTVIMVIYISAETVFAYYSKPGIYATTKRWLAGAPEVEVYDQKWVFAKTVPCSLDEMRKFDRGNGAYKDQMYTLNTYPANPPFIFLPKDKDVCFKYSSPTSFWLHGV